MCNELITIDPHSIQVPHPFAKVHSGVAKQFGEEALLLGIVPDNPLPVVSGISIREQLAPFEDCNV